MPAFISSSFKSQLCLFTYYVSWLSDWLTIRYVHLYTDWTPNESSKFACKIERLRHSDVWLYIRLYHSGGQDLFPLIRLPDVMYYLLGWNLMHKLGFYSKIFKMQHKGDLGRKIRAPYCLCSSLYTFQNTYYLAQFKFDRRQSILSLKYHLLSF